MKNQKNFCHLCDGEIGLGEVCFSFGNRAVCSDCADGITTEELYFLTGTRTARELLVTLGFDHGVLF